MQRKSIIDQTSNPLTYINKQINITQYSSQKLLAARSISPQFVYLFYGQFALLLDTKTLQITDKIVYPQFTQNREVFGQKFLVTKDGFIIQIDGCHYFENHQYSYANPYKNKNCIYFSKLYFSETNLFILPFPTNFGWAQYIGTQKITLYLKNQIIGQFFVINSFFRQANDSSLLLTEINQHKNKWTFYDFLSKTQFIYELPKIITNPKQVQSLSIIDKNKGIIILSTIGGTYSMYQFDNYNNSQQSKKVLSYKNCKAMKIFRRRKNLTHVFVNYYDSEKQQNVSKNIVYSLKTHSIIWQKDLINPIVKGSIWQNYFSHDMSSFVQYVKQSDKITCYEAIKKNRVYIHIIHKSGIRDKFGNGVAKEILKALN